MAWMFLRTPTRDKENKSMENTWKGINKRTNLS